MRYLIFGIFLFVYNQVFSTVASNNITLSNAPLITCFSINNSENFNVLKDSSFLNFAFPSMEEIAKKACNYKIKPQSITVSVGLISATWETAKLCK